MRTMLFVAITVAAILPSGDATGRDTGVDPRIITFGAEREQIKSIPIEQRPNRPLHVYGNTVRRRQSRGSAPRSSLRR
jgi:hypothetical protein